MVYIVCFSQFLLNIPEKSNCFQILDLKIIGRDKHDKHLNMQHEAANNTQTRLKTLPSLTDDVYGKFIQKHIWIVDFLWGKQSFS